MLRKRGGQPASKAPQRHGSKGAPSHQLQSDITVEEEGVHVDRTFRNKLIDETSDKGLSFRYRENVKDEPTLAGPTSKLVLKDYMIIGLLGTCMTAVPLVLDFRLLGSSEEFSTLAVLLLQLISCCCFVNGAKNILQYLKGQDARRFNGVVKMAMDDVRQKLREARQTNDPKSCPRTFDTLMDEYKDLLDQCTPVVYGARQLATDLHHLGVQQARSYHENFAREAAYFQSILAKTEQMRTHTDALQEKRGELNNLTAYEHVSQQNKLGGFLLMEAEARGERENLKEKLRAKEAMLQKQLNDFQCALKKLDMEEHEEWIICSQDVLD